MRPHLLGLALVLGLTGCSSGDVVMREPPAGYPRDAGARAAAADWSQTEDVTAELSEFRFEPSTLVFREGVPTRLTLRNVGDRTHTFVSKGFFKAIAAHKLVSTSGEVRAPYLDTIEVPSGEEKRLYFVPVQKGFYPLECSILLHDVLGMEGEIIIE